MIDKKSGKCFLTSMMATFYVLSLILGFIYVEKNARNVILEDSPPFLVYKRNNFKFEFLKIHFMGKDYTLIFDKK